MRFMVPDSRPPVFEKSSFCLSCQSISMPTSADTHHLLEHLGRVFDACPNVRRDLSRSTLSVSRIEAKHGSTRTSLRRRTLALRPSSDSSFCLSSSSAVPFATAFILPGVLYSGNGDSRPPFPTPNRRLDEDEEEAAPVDVDSNDERVSRCDSPLLCLCA